jgi:tripartite-type tricarboxylate transporter receptor subunit TctC
MKRYAALAAIAGGLLGAIFGAVPGTAQDAFPTRRVTIVVPSPAGSTTDSLARLVAEQLQRKWGSAVIVENNGRGLNAGAEQVARSTADGYTLLITAPMPLTFANLLYRDIGYQSSQFVPVSLLAKIPNVLAVRKDFPAKDVKELVAFAKANPGKVTYASSAAGSTAHLSGAQLEVRAGIKMTHVPYRGSAPATNALLAGEVQAQFDQTCLPHVKAGKLIGLAMLAEVRHPDFPDVPTLREQGYGKDGGDSWFGILAPTGTSPEVVAKLDKAIADAVRSPDVIDKLHKGGCRVTYLAPTDFRDCITNETKMFGNIIQKGDIKLQ